MTTKDNRYKDLIKDIQYMRKLLTILSFFFIATASYAQPVDFSTYERVIQRGEVSIVRQSDEYRLIVGSLKNPKICLFLGIDAEQAARQIDRIRLMGEDENHTRRNRLVSYCGECFFLSVSGVGEQHTQTFRMINTSEKFSLNTPDILAIIGALNR